MNRPEEDLHKAVKQLLDSGLPETAVAWHTANQRGTRKKWENALLKSLGVLAGIPDWFILWRGALLGIELKPKGRYLTPVQRDVHARLTTAGAVMRTCRSVDEVAEFLSQIMGDEWRATVT